MTNADPAAAFCSSKMILPFKDELPKTTDTDFSRQSPIALRWAKRIRKGWDKVYEICVIDSKVYENHINDEVHRTVCFHQLAFPGGKGEGREGSGKSVEMAKRYGEDRGGKVRRLAYPRPLSGISDRTDLAELKAAELTPLTAVLKEHDAKSGKAERRHRR